MDYALKMMDFALKMMDFGSDRVSSDELSREREQSDFRFSKSFIKDGDEIAAKLHVAVHADGKSSTCAVM